MSKTPRPKVPTAELVRASVSRFERDEKYGLGDRVLTRIFKQYPLNDDVEHVLVKVVLLNSLYNTNVFAISEMAKHIYRLGIDSDLKAGRSSTVSRIAALTIRDKVRHHYSFATKYCSWHFPEKFPIYDSLVERLLWRYQSHYSFGSFERADLKDYARYKAVLEAFRRHFGLEAFAHKQIDRFLWFYGKDLSQRVL